MGLLSLPLCCANWILPKRLVSGQRFDETLRYSEDSLFLCGALSRCETVCYDPQPLYEYRIGREGNTVGRRTLEKSLETLRAWEAIYGLFRDRDGKAPQVLLKRLTELCCEARRLALKENKRPQAAACREKSKPFSPILKSDQPGAAVKFPGTKAVSPFLSAVFFTPALSMAIREKLSPSPPSGGTSRNRSPRWTFVSALMRSPRHVTFSTAAACRPKTPMRRGSVIFSGSKPGSSFRAELARSSAAAS